MSSKYITLIMIYLATGIIYLTAGLSKFSPGNIGNLIGPVDYHKISDSTVFLLFMQGIAVLQVVVGALLLSQRYSVFGLIMVLPMSLGILIFTIVAGFGLTPIINLLLLLLLLYAFYLEKEAIRQLFRKDRKGILFKSPSFQQFPERLVPNIALILIGLTVLVSFLDNIVLNILTTTALLLFTINLFQRKDYIFADKILIFLFLMISSISVNGMLINKMIAKGFYVVFLLIPMGILIYLFRLVYWKFSEKNVQDRQNQVKEG
ncbi:MAG: hypothetical protein QY315_11700 [Saprospiraceae bacterium]|nr:MAG: hypothetical protein QY315_11700 [Saprospiraceae bacterium]